jgi:hypothetical protein
LEVQLIFVKKSNFGKDFTKISDTTYEDYWALDSCAVRYWARLADTVQSATSTLAGFEIVTHVVKNICVFWDITLCGPLKVNIRFEGTSPPSSGRKNKPDKNPVQLFSTLVSCFAGSSILKTEATFFLRNVDWILTVLYRRRYNSSLKNIRWIKMINEM